jgi:hypothetical protein
MPAPTAQSDAERVAKSRSRLYLSIQYEQAKYTAATRYLTGPHCCAAALAVARNSIRLLRRVRVHRQAGLGWAWAWAGLGWAGLG